MNKNAPDPNDPPEDGIPPTVEQAITGLISEIDQLRQEIEQNNIRIQDLEKLADRDPLVPLANRRAFMHELERFNDLAERYGTPSSVIYLDVDGMKRINDGFGHGAGDRILVAIAEILLASVRASDVVGRLGGDEFGIILAHMDKDMAAEKAGSLADIIAATRIEHDGKAIAVSVAWGVFTFTGETDIATALAA
ncbi:MAG: GGDEF domain-containing protein, partial [Alphaproteobacteria bacterium]